MAEEPTLEEKIKNIVESSEGKPPETPVIRVVNTLLYETAWGCAQNIVFYLEPDGTTKTWLYDGGLIKTLKIPVALNPIKSRIALMAGMDLSRCQEPQTGKIDVVFTRYFPEREVEEKRAGDYTAQTFAPSENELQPAMAIYLNSLTVYERAVPKEQYERYRGIWKTTWDKLKEELKNVLYERATVDWLNLKPGDYQAVWDKLLPQEEALFIKNYEAVSYKKREVRKPERD